MADRFEFEIDTTQPREQWMKEVEANMKAEEAKAITT
jgi:3-ketosteroid 9alpha-monooxygenase subunit A